MNSYLKTKTKKYYKIAVPYLHIYRIHSFIKLHKSNHSIRLLINFKIAPSYNLANSLIKKKLNIVYYTFINDTYDFVEKINNINFKLGCKMISLDQRFPNNGPRTPKDPQVYLRRFANLNIVNNLNTKNII